MPYENRFLRYPDVQGITSKLDPIQDVLTFLNALRATDYLEDVLFLRHGIPRRMARKRAKRIIPHMDAVLEYVDQAMGGPLDVSFLPAYYAVLNMLKVCILVGPHHEALSSNRTHGVSYKVDAKDSHSPMTEVVKIWPKGAFPLFYKTVTGRTIGREFLIQMRDVYPYVGDISAEYELATGERAKICRVVLEGHTAKHREGIEAVVMPLDPRLTVTKRHIKLLKGEWKKVPDTMSRHALAGLPGGSAVYHGPMYSQLAADLDARLRSSLNTFLIYHPEQGVLGSPHSSGHFLLPEEVPSTLLFFHMSSVVRYKPEFLARMRDSKYWPMFLAARRHSLLKMLTLLWSFVHRRTLVLKHE